MMLSHITVIPYKVINNNTVTSVTYLVPVFTKKNLSLNLEYI
jgi:hypothetical protein